MKRWLLLLFVVGCVKREVTPFDKQVHRELAGDVTIRRADTREVRYEAYRIQKISFDVDATGTLTRTEFDIPGAAVPAAVRAALTGSLNRIRTARVVFQHGIVTFVIESGGGDERWTIDANGKILDYTNEEEDDCCDD